MAEITTNAREVAADLRGAARKFSVGLERGILAVIIGMERGAVKRLTGSGAAGSYPVPVRTGFLRRSLGHKVVNENSGLVFATASYAHAIHEGNQHVGTPPGNYIKSVTPRRFILDAVEDFDTTRTLEREVDKELHG